MALRGRFPEDVDEEQTRQLAGMAPGSCEQVAATALLASADTPKGTPATRSSSRRSSLPLQFENTSADKDRVQRYHHHNRKFVSVRGRRQGLALTTRTQSTQSATPPSFRSGTPLSTQPAPKARAGTTTRSTNAVRYPAASSLDRSGGHNSSVGHPAGSAAAARSGCVSAAGANQPR